MVQYYREPSLKDTRSGDSGAWPSDGLQGGSGEHLSLNTHSRQTSSWVAPQMSSSIEPHIGGGTGLVPLSTTGSKEPPPRAPIAQPAPPDPGGPMLPMLRSGLLP